MNCLANSTINEIVVCAKFNNALGIVNLFRGIACFIGPWTGCGIKLAASGDHLAAFYFSGAWSPHEAIICVCTHSQKKKRKKETVFSTFENCKIPKHAEHDKLD